MKPWGTALLVAAVVTAGTTAYLVTRPDGNSVTDTTAAEVADAIGYPVGSDANAYARSALAQQKDSPNFAVIEITDPANPNNEAEKPRASLVFRIHDPGNSDAPGLRLWNRDPVTACYRADFNYYGVIDGGPQRVRCPENAKALAPPPAPRTGVPDDYLEAFKRILAALPPAPTPEDVLAALRAGLPPVPVDETTKLPWTAPHLDAAVKASGIGIIAAGGGSCLAGVRLADGTVAAWYPPRVQTRPGEHGCWGESALTLYSAPAPK